MMVLTTSLRTLFAVSLITTFFVVNNAFAQVSKVEGIVPLEGVAFPKADMSQSHPINSSNLIRIGFINTDQLFKLTGKKNNKESLEFLNLKLKSFAEKFKIGLILQKAVYVNPKSDITLILYSYIIDKPFSNDFALKLPMANLNVIRFINTDRLFKESEKAKNSQQKLENEFKIREKELASFSDKSSEIFVKRKEDFQNDLNRRKNEELQMALEYFNKKALNLSREMNIDLIIQEAVYVSPELDITNQILLMER
jgi:outer membrane protein